MKYPDFFNKVEQIKMIDPLADVLGAFEEGYIEYSYLDIVKMAGHSCPTVAGAYLMTLVALKELYVDEIPVRGMIKVEFPDSKTEGVTGVIAAVISNITGATEDTGFKGISGKFSRINLMEFSKDINSSIKFSRIDNNKTVRLVYDPSIVPANPKMQGLMQLTISGKANKEEKALFGKLWQERVEKILLEKDLYNTISIV